MTELSLDAELCQDRELIANIQNLDEKIISIESLFDSLLNADYNSMSMMDKIKHDLLIVFTLNSLYWMYLRLGGFDPTTHKIKSELDRIKTAMDRAKGAMAKPNMPRVNKEAAGRFVGHALWIRDGKKKRMPDNLERQNKKLKFDENGDPKP